MVAPLAAVAAVLALRAAAGNPATVFSMMGLAILFVPIVGIACGTAAMIGIQKEERETVTSQAAVGLLGNGALLAMLALFP